MSKQKLNFRASALGALMTGNKVKTAQERLTQLQHADYIKLCETETSGKLTAAQEKKLNGFSEKINAPYELKQTAMNYIYEVFLNYNYGFIEDFENKYTVKGTIAENESIRLLSEVTGRVLIQNSVRKTDDNNHLTGEADLVLDDTIVDVKTSWSPLTFMKADLSDIYEWQLRAYMFLYKKKKAQLAYCLVDAPDLIFNDIERRAFWQKGIIDPASDKALEITAQLQTNYIYSANEAYSNKADRVKIYDIAWDGDKEKMMLDVLKMAYKTARVMKLNQKK